MNDIYMFLITSTGGVYLLDSIIRAYQYYIKFIKKSLHVFTSFIVDLLLLTFPFQNRRCFYIGTQLCTFGRIIDTTSKGHTLGTILVVLANTRTTLEK